MEYQTIHDVSEVARAYAGSTRASRCARIKWFATLLERHQGTFSALKPDRIYPGGAGPAKGQLAARNRLRKCGVPRRRPCQRSAWRGGALFRSDAAPSPSPVRLSQGTGAVTPDTVARRAHAMPRSPSLGGMWHRVRSRLGVTFAAVSAFAHQALAAAVWN
jgi:hypothetical protein